ncbi:MAG TPA: CsbD family protein [Pseudolabrys sp.]|nr:CsbD family protein [Pseudolabrys sp.]
MDKDRIRGAGKQVSGNVKQAIGKVTGDKQTEVEGAAEKTAGKVQSEFGKAKDAVRDAFRN